MDRFPEIRDVLDAGWITSRQGRIADKGGLEVPKEDRRYWKLGWKLPGQVLAAAVLGRKDGQYWKLAGSQCRKLLKELQAL